MVGPHRPGPVPGRACSAAPAAVPLAHPGPGLGRRLHGTHSEPAEPTAPTTRAAGRAQGGRLRAALRGLLSPHAPTGRGSMDGVISRNFILNIVIIQFIMNL